MTFSAQLIDEDGSEIAVLVEYTPERFGRLNCLPEDAIEGEPEELHVYDAAGHVEIDVTEEQEAELLDLAQRRCGRR